MSLHDIAKHVQSQGRGEDTVLVHMTPREVGGLQALAKANGGSLTRNPQTGLYEAGFLSSVLPMVAGVATAAFAPELLPLVAGGIGLADYAMTGSLGQGLMAGLSAWSAGSLGSSLAAAGETGMASAGGDAAADAFKESQAKALEAAGGDEVNQAAARDLAKSQIQSMPNLTGDQITNMTGSGLTNANAADVVRGAGAANAAMNVTPAQAMGAGIMSPSAIGSAISNAPLAAAGVALPLVSGSLFKQPTVNAPTSSVSTVNQPLQRLSPNYQGTQPVPPNPHYQAQYPNYVQTPYDPRATGGTSYAPAVAAADGGLMQGGPAQVDFMGGDMYPQSQIQRSYYATPTQAPTGAQQAMASYEPKTNPLTGEPTAHMAEGGIAGLAAGGNPADHVYRPSYTNYAQTPYAPAATQQYPNYAQTPFNPATAPTYGGIPTPTRAPMGTAQNPGIAGYAIDPMKMIGSPAYNAEQARIAAEQAAADAAARAADPFGIGQMTQDFGWNGNGKAGGLMPDDLAYAGGGILAFAQGGQKPVGNKDMAAIDNYTEQAQSGGIASVKDAADKGDWNAQLALQKLGYKAAGGISDLGSYSDGGRLLKGPGDGVSDDIPAQIGARQPARLADGEFVVPARIVSELGNGSTDAGAKRLYAMMDRVQAKRKKSMGKGKFAVNSKAEKDLPA
jgi:hypothetical protein